MNRVQIFIKKTMEKDFLEMTKFIGLTTEEAINIQFQRIMVGILYFAIAIFFLTQQLWTAAALFLGMTVIVYRLRYSRVQSAYKNARYNQQISYSIFARLVDTYLDSRLSLYAIFQKILNRLKTDQSRESLSRLMGRIQDDSEDKEAFKEFASELSITDNAQNFMMTLYYSQMAPEDKNVVKELGQMAVKEVFDSISEIVEIKSARIEKNGRHFLMVSFILLVGILMAMAIMYFNQVMTPITG